jgi:hypothetical protein
MQYIPVNDSVALTGLRLCLRYVVSVHVPSNACAGSGCIKHCGHAVLFHIPWYMTGFAVTESPLVSSIVRFCMAAKEGPATIIKTMTKYNRAIGRDCSRGGLLVRVSEGGREDATVPFHDLSVLITHSQFQERPGSSNVFGDILGPSNVSDSVLNIHC